jgi:hypothetical protein
MRCQKTLGVTFFLRLTDADEDLVAFLWRELQLAATASAGVLIGPFRGAVSAEVLP